MNWEEIDKEFDLISKYVNEHINMPIPLTFNDSIRIYKETGNFIFNSSNYYIPSFKEWKFYNKHFYSKFTK